VLVPVKNPELLAHAIRRLIEDPELCTAMGANGRVLAESEFDVRQVVEKHLQIYSEVLNECSERSERNVTH
jgi:glycosyltransferase involved in cell wall biosynthesis